MPQHEGKMTVFTVNIEREKQREGEVRWCQRWDFADSIFTHQTELFPVSTWPSSPLSPPLLLFLSQSSCVLSLLLFSPSGHLSGPFPFNIVNFYRVCFPSPGPVVCLYFLHVLLLPFYCGFKPFILFFLSFSWPRYLSVSTPPSISDIRHWISREQTSAYPAKLWLSNVADNRPVYKECVSWFNSRSFVALSINTNWSSHGFVQDKWVCFSI